jgi:hypothetical protein
MDSIWDASNASQLAMNHWSAASSTAINGEDYVPEPYIQQAAQQARKHRWYDSAMQVVVNDLYAFDPNKRVDIEEFTDIIGRNFKQP